jgi:hypothetical protein
MPGTLQGLAVVLIAVLPGALYVWSYERQAGQWRVGSPDRLLNFLGVSVVLHALAALPGLVRAGTRSVPLPADLPEQDKPLGLDARGGRRTRDRGRPLSPARLGLRREVFGDRRAPNDSQLHPMLKLTQTVWV